MTDVDSRVAGAVDEAERATEAFHAAWRAMMATFPAGRWERRGDLVVSLSGLPVPFFNGVWVTSPEPPAVEVLQVVDELAAGDLPWNLQVRGTADPELAEELTARSLVPTADIPLMVATRADVDSVPVPLEAVPVVTYEDAGHHLRLLELAFGMPEDVTRRGFPLSVFSADGLTTLLGREGGEVVTTGVRVQTANAVGVFNIATPQEQRGRGLGGAITLRLVQDGFADGADLAYLQASPLGEPVYRRLGFRTVESWQQWVPKSLLG